MGTPSRFTYTYYSLKRITTTMADAAAPAPAKAKAPKKKQAKPTHPPYSVMIIAAIKALKERSGSSKHNILKYIVANYKVGDQASIRLNIALRKLGKAGKLKQVKGVGARGSFRIPPKAPSGKPRGRPKSKKPKKAAKKPAKKAKKAKKPAAKKAAKKPAAKKAAKPAAKKAAKKPAAKKPAKKAAKA